MALSRDAMLAARRQPVALLLLLLLSLALYWLPFLSYAPNRLVSGQPLMLGQVSDAGWLALPLAALYTPYVFPSENGLRCDSEWLQYGDSEWRGRFHFNLSRYSQRQLHETSHRHLLREEEGSWLNLDGFHMGVGGDDSWSPSVSAEYLLTQRRWRYALRFFPSAPAPCADDGKSASAAAR